MIDPQFTLRRNARISGTGLHTGQPVEVSILPAPPDSGIVFRRVDLPGAPEIPADIDLVVDTHRGTTLARSDGVQVRTAEHLLAALTGLGIWNCVVELDAEELPACDGSSSPFVKVIRESGTLDQEVPQDRLVIDREIHFECQRSGSRFRAFPADTLSVDITLEFPHLVGVPTQHVRVTGLPSSFESEVAPSRTFCHTSELNYLIGQGLARGGTLNNAVVIYDGIDPYEEILERLELVPDDLDEPAPGEPLWGFPFRLENEPARHKLLDVLGDLALVGRPILGTIEAERPGHTGNTSFARHLCSIYSDNSRHRTTS